MPWPVIYRAKRPLVPAVGDAWLLEEWDRPDVRDFYLRHFLSSEYRRDWLTRRPPLRLVLPGNTGPWLVDGRFQREDGTPLGEARPGWTVQLWGEMADGRPLHLTVTPAVNIVGHWHGWVRAGTISNDVEGRRYA